MIREFPQGTSEQEIVERIANAKSYTLLIHGGLGLCKEWGADSNVIDQKELASTAAGQRLLKYAKPYLDRTVQIDDGDTVEITLHRD